MNNQETSKIIQPWWHSEHVWWMVFSLAWVVNILFSAWAYAVHDFDSSGPRGIWRIVAILASIAFCIVYGLVLQKVYFDHTWRVPPFTSSEILGYRAILMFLGVVLTILPESQSYDLNFVWIFVAIGFILTSIPRQSTQTLLLVAAGTALLLEMSGRDHQLASTLVFMVAFGFMVIGNQKNSQLIGELYVERSRVRDQAITEERFRLARDLHDTIGHSMTQITLKAQLARKLLTNAPERASLELAEIEQLSRDLSATVRQSIAGDVTPTLASELQRAAELLGAADITLGQQIDTTGLTEAQDALFGWVVREGTLNVIKHSAASRCEIILMRSSENLRLTIRDNGTSIASDIVPGQGLTGLRQRAEAIGGSLHWRQTDSGFVVEVEVPAS